MSELSVILISPFCTQFHCFALNFTFLHSILLFCTGEIALLTNLGLIDKVSANQTTEIVACILLSWKRRKLLIIKVAYRNLAVHISLNPIGRSFQWQLRRLTWTNLFERSTNQPLFPAVFFSSKHKKQVWFLLLSPDKIMWLLARLHISTREVL